MSDHQSSTPPSSSKLHQNSSHRILSSWASLRRRLRSSTQQIDTAGATAKTSRHTKQRRARRRSSETTLSISTRSSYGSIDDQDDNQQIQCIPTEVQMTTTRRPSYVPCQRQEDVVSTDGRVCDLQYTYIHDSITYEGIYTGQVKCSKPHGIGTWRYQSSNGSVLLSIEGEWFCGFSIAGEKTREHIPQKHSLIEPLPSILRRSTKHKQERDVYNKSVHFKREATLVTFRSLPCLHEGDREDSSSASSSISIGEDDKSIASIDSIEGVYEEFILKTTTPPAA